MLQITERNAWKQHGPSSLRACLHSKSHIWVSALRIASLSERSHFRITLGFQNMFAVSCMPTCDGSTMCLAVAGSWITLPAAQLVQKSAVPLSSATLSAPWWLSSLGLWCALVVEFLPATPEAVAVPVLWAQAFPADPPGAAAAQAPATLWLQCSLFLAAEKDFLKRP